MLAVIQQSQQLAGTARTFVIGYMWVTAVEPFGAHADCRAGEANNVGG